MWFSLVSVVLVILVVLWVYVFVIKPKRLMAFYKKEFSQHFRVFEYPLAPMMPA
jgi:ABC-type nickel/cobalt efflux system permease component RcnA